jgi:predicted enzyme related to lactoylglutathione lyase
MNTTGLFKKIDCYLIPVPDLARGIAFYRDQLGHKLLWQRETQAGLQMSDTDTEIVLNTDNLGETDLLVESAQSAFTQLLARGCKQIDAPFEIAVGWCAVVEDPFGNRIGFLDLSKVSNS